MRPFVLLVPALLLLVAGCRTVDRGLLGLHSVAGGIHNKRRASGIQPFFLPDGRLGCAANGALLLERSVDGELVRLLDASANLEDVAPAPDGASLVCVSGRDQVTAGGGHNDHVWQVYALELEDGLTPSGWRRVTRSERAETLPRFTPDGTALVFVRRPDYDAWRLEGDPWGPGAVVVRDAASGVERQVGAARFQPVRGLALDPNGGACLLAAPGDDGRVHVFEVELDGGAATRLVEDARLPALDAAGTLYFVRTRADGDALLRAGRDGRDERTLLSGRARIDALAVSADGARLAFVEHEPDGGPHGTDALFERRADGSLARATFVKCKDPRVTKLWDAVRPMSWWFDEGSSPGSR